MRFNGLTLSDITADAFRPVHRRAEMLLRVFVVALGLVYLCDDPGPEELGDAATINTHDGEELGRNGAQPHRKVAPAIQEVTRRPYRPDAGRRDASVFKAEEGGDHKERQGFLKNVHGLMRRDTQVDDPSTPNQSGGAAGSRHQRHHVFSARPPALSRLYVSAAENPAEQAAADGERDYFWCLWNTFSVLYFVMKYLGRAFRNKYQPPPAPATHSASEAPLPDSRTLQRFHSRCIRGSSEKRNWEVAFLEGFANDLLDAMRSVCDRSGGMVIEDFQMDDARSILVPFTPPEPFRFQCFLQKERLGMQVCGQIKLVEATSQSCCRRQSPGADEVLCLLHCDTKRRIKSDVCGGHAAEDSLLSKSQVTKWFQSTIKQAWGIVSHRYEFEVNTGHTDAPGALQVRFRSGKVVNFAMNPVVELNAGAHFLTSRTPGSSDDIWTLSLGSYEDRFFKQRTRYLPANSCAVQTLEIALFLHRRQTALTGGSELQDSHFKTALMHLLLLRDPSQWKPTHLASRLRDLLDFIEKSLEKKMLRHVPVGNPPIRKVAEVPAAFTQADAVNLFHPLVIHNCLHRNAVKHFQEILRNAHILVDDYVRPCSGPEAE